LKQQISGWEILKKKFKNEQLPQYFEDNYIWVKNYLSLVERFVDSYKDQIDVSNLEYYLNQFLSQSNGYQVAIDKNKKILLYNSPEVEYLFEVCKNVGVQISNTVYLGLTSEYINQITNSNDLYGQLLAYEFKMKDYSKILERRSSEKISISKIRSDFQNYLSQVEGEVNADILNIQNKYSIESKKIDELEEVKTSEFDLWFDDIKQEKWGKWFNGKESEILKLEETYQEKLKLSEPAKHWGDLSDRYTKYGWISLGIALLITLISSSSLYYLLVNTPEQIYKSFFNDDKSTAIRWSIIFITFVSFLAFLLRAITKYMFSCFHLATDSKERYTLTYFYLSLSKNTPMDLKERELIMQSLFSRAETGLLKDDSSPSMPNDILSKIMK
jgi:Family of unknown function (DUF6161)